MSYHHNHMQAGDELAALLERNLTFQQYQQQQQAPQHQPPQQAPAQTQEEPILFSSQHYYHCPSLDHDNVTPLDVPRPSSEPPQIQQPTTEQLLLQHEVDPTVLSASQMDLFKTADDEQKWRLIQLWKICPPTNQQANPAVAWSSTTVGQEEQLAKLRQDRKMEEESQHSRDSLSLDGTPLTPAQDPDGPWLTSYVEPYMMSGYMMSGYEALARREYLESAQQDNNYTTAPTIKNVYPSHFGSAVNQDNNNYRPATDPVYNNNQGDSWPEQKQPIEFQYGAYQSAMEM